MQGTGRVPFSQDARERPHTGWERFSSEEGEVHPGAGWLKRMQDGMNGVRRRTDSSKQR